MIKEYEKYYGSVFARLISRSTHPVSIANFSGQTKSSFIIFNEVGLYIKHCSNRVSPWRFTFDINHKEELNNLKSRFDEVFLTLVCKSDGIAVLNFQEVKALLNLSINDVGWIFIQRRKRTKYLVKGKDGNLDYKIGVSDFPRKILDYVFP